MHTSRCVAVWGVLRLAVTRGSASAVLPLLAAQPTGRLAAAWSAAPAGTRTDGPRSRPAILHQANNPSSVSIKPTVVSLVSKALELDWA